MTIINELIISILTYLKSDWMILLIGTFIAVTIKVYIDPKKFKDYIERKSKTTIISSVTFGALTPLCACGTMAVILSMFVTSMPWGPVMAFLVSSPLTGPSDYYFQASILGIKFANIMFITSIVMGLTAGLIAHYLDKKTNFFKSQFRTKEDSCSSCQVNYKEKLNEEKGFKISTIEKFKFNLFIKELYQIGFKKILLLFILFVAISQIVEMTIPPKYILSVLGSENTYSVPLASMIGLPLYVSGPSSIPLLKTLIENGAGEGAILAFLITGQATGLPVVLGMSTIIKKRAILFYVVFVLVAGILSGYVYNLFLI